MTLQQLRDFMAVVAHGGYRSAARALDVAQAGLTKSIARLEREHGVVLLERSGKGVTLSADGAALLRRAQAIVLEADRTEAWLQAAAQARANAAATLALGVSIEPALQLVPMVLNDFHHALPDVSVRMTQGVATALLAGVRENRLELAVMRLPAVFDAGDLTVQVLFESQSVVAARADHPLCRGDVLVRADELSTCEWAVLGDPTQPALNDASMQELFVARSAQPPRVRMVTDSLFDVLALLLKSDLLARLPAELIDHPLVAGRLRALKLEPALEQEGLPRYRIAIVHKAARPLSPEARALAAMLSSFTRSQVR